MENHLDLKDGGLEWPLCVFVYQGGVKKKKEFPERWGFFLEQLITEIYPHQLECKSTVNTPALANVPHTPKLKGHFLIWPKLVDAAKQCMVLPWGLLVLKRVENFTTFKVLESNHLGNLYEWLQLEMAFTRNAIMR